MILHPPIPTAGLGEADIEPLRQRVARIVGDSYDRARHEV